MTEQLTNRAGSARRRAILFGDYTAAPYHPLRGIDDEVTGIVAGSFEVESTEDADALSAGLSDAVDVLISYADQWTGTVSDEQADGLLAYVRSGGGLVSLHCGISLANHDRLLPLFGARFTGHPPFQRLAFSLAEGAGFQAVDALSAAVPTSASAAEGNQVERLAFVHDEDVLRGALDPFELDEEPYRYEFAEAPNGDRTVLLIYAHEGALYPAVWTQTYGHGRVVNVMPGHTVESLRHPSVRRLLAAAVEWAAGA